MATYSESLRQGLPRTPGAEAWPPNGVKATIASSTSAPEEVAAVVTQPVVEAAPIAVAAAAPTVSAAGSALRQGLPRVAGQGGWPPLGTAPGSAPASPVVSVINDSEIATAVPPSTVEPVAPAEPTVAANAASDTLGELPVGGVPLRQGLPRKVGEEPWPPKGSAPASYRPRAEAIAPVISEEHAAVTVTTPARHEAVAVEKPAVEAVSVAVPRVAMQSAPVAAAPKQAAASVEAPKAPAAPKREPVMIKGKSLSQWVKLIVLGGVGAIVAAAILVLAARGVTTLPGVPAFLERFPGEYHLPESSEPGFPGWARWTHFLNIFLMVLIIRSGLLVRTQQQPPAFWTPKKGGKKISINLWLHTSLDLVWMLNGLVFVVLLFISGHWVRIVPTSWEVFPNALSALLQYMTLDWPVENGWVNYNSLQQIMYFLVVFVAAPLAAITGIRMSEWWPEKATRLNKMYPAPVARAIHFPTMLFFVLFILIHVFLVLSTGALRNLNHMFAGTDLVNWAGFWFFALAIFATAVGWVVARPMLMAPIASLFGKVSNR